MRMTKLMREIATASQEQSRGIEQVNIAVNQMDETAQQMRRWSAIICGNTFLENVSRADGSDGLFKLTTQTA